MIIIGWLASDLHFLLPLILTLVVGYGNIAYRHGLPSPITSKHERTLRHIEQLEIALGYREDDQVVAERERAERIRRECDQRRREYDELLALARTRQPVEIQRNPYSFAPRPNHETVEIDKIDPKDRNPHQQDYLPERET